jgi:hypothetical protein
MNFNISRNSSSLTSPWWFGSNSCISYSTTHKLMKKSIKDLITFLLCPAAHSLSTDVEVVPWDVAFVLKHIVDLLIDVLSLEFANIGVLLIDIILVLAVLDIIILIKVLLLLLLIGQVSLLDRVFVFLLDRIDTLPKFFKLLRFHPSQVLVMLFLHFLCFCFLPSLLLLVGGEVEVRSYLVGWLGAWLFLCRIRYQRWVGMLGQIDRGLVLERVRGVVLLGKSRLRAVIRHYSLLL